MGIEAVASTGHTGVQYGRPSILIMKRIWSWLLGALVATPIVFLGALFVLVAIGSVFFLLWILYQ
ncbi:MAG: hypothetical protein H6595_12985 [Flavobacteriales bacterium]|nr:hypothetical protein [Flavobacteriales bacterium]MCB9168379.1 hypothetical protein [Flavobacteriales bacterium]